ncbi:MAG: precorrin-2 C(20)-methyltransferase [Planctomycetota bacterium]
MDWTHALPGHFYAVGIGPGAADLLTLRAVRLIESCDCLVAPRSRLMRSSRALDAVRAHVHRQEVVEHVYAMKRDDDATRQSWHAVAVDCAQRCQRGEAVVQVTLGDPLIYSTSCYLLDALRSRLPAGHLHVVPGISAFQASAAHFTEALTLQEDQLCLMPASDLTAVAKALDSCQQLVLYKIGAQLPGLIALLRERGLLGQARMVSNAEQAGQQVFTRLDTADPQAAYLSCVLIRVAHRAWASSEAVA